MSPGLPPDNFDFPDLFPPVFSSDGHLIAVVFPEHGANVMVFDTGTGKRIHNFKGHALPVTCLEFSRDGSKLVSGSKDCTALVWDLSAANKKDKPKTLTAAELDAYWMDLASHDARRAYRAIVSLRQSGPQAVELIRARLKPEVFDVKEIERQIRDLGAGDKAIREAAHAALQRIAPQVEPILLDAFKAEVNAEARRRLEQLLKEITCFETSPERLRNLRAIEVLEGIGDDKARELLEGLAKANPPITRFGWELQATIERLKRR